MQKKSNEENLAEILEVFETIFSEINESDLEFILNNIVSILVTVDIEQTSSHFQEFCDKLLVAAKNYSDFRLVLLRVLWLLFQVTHFLTNILSFNSRFFARGLVISRKRILMPGI